MKFLTLLVFTGAAMAQTPQSLDARLAALDSAVKSAQSAGDNAWMLIVGRAGADDDRARAWRCFTAGWSAARTCSAP